LRRDERPRANAGVLAAEILGSKLNSRKQCEQRELKN
jgi:hypothetical protein